MIRYDLVQNLSLNTQQNAESYTFSEYQETFSFRQKITVSGSGKDADIKLRIYDVSGSATNANTTLVGTTNGSQLVLLVSEISLYYADGTKLSDADKLNHVAQDGDGVILYNLGNDWTFQIDNTDAQGEPQAFNAIESYNFV